MGSENFTHPARTSPWIWTLVLWIPRLLGYRSVAQSHALDLQCVVSKTRLGSTKSGMGGSCCDLFFVQPSPLKLGQHITNISRLIELIWFDLLWLDLIWLIDWLWVFSCGCFGFFPTNQNGLHWVGQILSPYDTKVVTFCNLVVLTLLLDGRSNWCLVRVGGLGRMRWRFRWRECAFVYFLFVCVQVCVLRVQFFEQGVEVRGVSIDKPSWPQKNMPNKKKKLWWNTLPQTSTAENGWFFFKTTNTVDGQNPAPLRMMVIPYLLGFSHPRWLFGISSINSTFLLGQKLGLFIWGLP